MPTLMIIVGSTRPGRAGLPIARWFTGAARSQGAFDVIVTDLAELDLPLLDEPAIPRLREYVHQHTRDWSAQVEAADAFVFITPEYNFGYPATIKNAIDYLHQEWHHKPVGFVSYGGIAAGTRAVQQLKQVVTTLRMVPLFEGVAIPFHPQFIIDGEFLATEIMDQAAVMMLDELARVEPALRPLRASSQAQQVTPPAEAARPRP